jgi:hypothetical protein
MRSRPYVTVKVPSSVHPGDAVKIEVIVESTSITPIESIEAELVGHQSARDQENTSSERQTIVSKDARICDERTLSTATYRFEATLQLPDDAPFTYTGYLSEIQYSVGVRVAIPWWPDATERVDLLVTPRPEPRPERAPAAFAGEAKGQPFIEIALDDRSFSPGEEITGAIALGDVQGRLLQGVSLSLIGLERLRLRLERAYEAHRTTTFLKASPSDEGRELPFRFRLPRPIAPAFDCGLIALTWMFEARIVGLEEAIRTVPIRIGAYTPPAAPASSSAERRPIGSGRWRDVWSEAAAKAGLSLDFRELKMRGSIEGLSASVRIEQGSDGAPALAAKLRWPSWEIGLRIGLSSFRERVFGEGDDVFGRYRVEGRDQAQARSAITSALRDALLAFDAVEMDDERALVRVRDPGKELPALERFLRKLWTLATKIREASADIPPPAALAAGVPEMSALAGDLGGRFVPGSMAIRAANFEAGVFDIETLFPEGSEPARTRIGLAIDPPLPKSIDSNNPADLAAAAGDARAKSLVGEILAGSVPAAMRFGAGGDRMEVDVAAWPIARPLLLEKMRAMLALRERLSGERRAGPYR